MEIRVRKRSFAARPERLFRGVVARDWLVKSNALTFVTAVAVVASRIRPCRRPGQEPRKDPQSSFEPRSQPGAGQKYLESFIGDWDVVKVFHPRSGEPVRTPGTCRQTMIHDGRFLQSEFVFDQGGRKSTGLGLIGFEAPTGQFTSVWTDSRQTRMSLRRSREPFDGKQIVLFSRSLDEEEGPGTRAAAVADRQPDRERWPKDRPSPVQRGADGKERLIMELIMTRKGPRRLVVDLGFRNPAPGSFPAQSTRPGSPGGTVIPRKRSRLSMNSRAPCSGAGFQPGGVVAILVAGRQRGRRDQDQPAADGKFGTQNGQVVGPGQVAVLEGR